MILFSGDSRSIFFIISSVVIVLPSLSYWNMYKGVDSNGPIERVQLEAGAWRYFGKTENRTSYRHSHNKTGSEKKNAVYALERDIREKETEKKIKPTVQIFRVVRPSSCPPFVFQALTSKHERQRRANPTREGVTTGHAAPATGEGTVWPCG